MDSDKAKLLIQTVIQADLLKNQSRLAECLRNSVVLTVPIVLPPDLLRLLGSERAIFSVSKVWRARLSVDCALAVYMRDEFTKQRTASQPIYLWLDSTPLAGHNWLMIRVMKVLCDDFSSLAAIAAAFDQLAAEKDRRFRDWLQLRLDGKSAPENEEYEVRKRTIGELSNLLNRSIDIHMLMPMGLGAKAKGLVHVVAAYHHALRHEVHSLLDLRRFNTDVRGVCTDMGTELGTAEAKQEPAVPWIDPDLVVAEDLQADPVDDV